MPVPTGTLIQRSPQIRRDTATLARQARSGRKGIAGTLRSGCDTGHNDERAHIS
jgi:hypothetical protein